jgi:eukaryotic-like serine/threonine-protein kinase
MADDDTRGPRADAGAPTADGTLMVPGYATTALAAPKTPVAALATSPATPLATPVGPDTIIPRFDVSAIAALPDPGYQLGEVIGRGGMGEVVVAQDQRILREVAVKRIRAKDPSPDAVTRFLREARIQARLDHPAIVPVYELGTDKDGLPYFTMKRLQGETLAKKLQRGGQVEPLLRAFVDVCLAVQVAHNAGVVHRDLKPSNIMLGDYGEVYVLDWGVARVMTDTKRTTNPSMSAHDEDGTTAGAILGTPGYMSPEQVRGFEADAKADVYALGAILFEILAGEALHPRGEAALSSTLTAPQEAPARRAADRKQIPPELDGVCFDALTEDPPGRPSARQVADRLQAYLDGDRDLGRRRTMASEQLVAAREALVADPKDGRATAMRRAGRALALDPDSPEAAELVTSLLLEPPRPDQTPPDLIDFLRDEEHGRNAARARQGIYAYLCLFIFWLAIPFMNVKSWSTLLVFYGLLVAGALSAWRHARRGEASAFVTMTLTGLIAVVFTRFAGPFILTPICVCVVLMQLAAIRYIAERIWIVCVWVLVVVTAPLAIEWLGLLDRTYEVSHGTLSSNSAVFDMTGRIDETFLIGANTMFLVFAAAIAATLSRRHLVAQQQLAIQAWHLRQLLPSKRWETEVPARDSRPGIQPGAEASSASLKR